MNYNIFAESLTLEEINYLMNALRSKRDMFIRSTMQALNDIEMSLIRDNHLFDAIRAYRKRCDTDLLTAKIACDSYRDSLK